MSHITSCILNRQNIKHQLIAVMQCLFSFIDWFQYDLLIIQQWLTLGMYRIVNFIIRPEPDSTG